jgi:surfeit locus 1 family protein
MFRLMFSRRWWLTTLFVIGGMALTVRMGFWQVGRYHQNKAAADHLLAMRTATPIFLEAGKIPGSLTGMEYRSVTAKGVFDFSQQVAVRNQVWMQDWGADTGYILVTPLVLGDGFAVMVDRGWIPQSDDTSVSWGQYDQPGEITVSGIVRLAGPPEMGGVPDPTLAPGQERLDIWNQIDLVRLQEQIPYSLLPVYIQQAPDAAYSSPPYRSLSEPDLSAAGTNVGYAGMWFAFALLLFGGYPLYLSKQRD